MKKYLKVILSFILMFILVSCAEKTEKTIFELDEPGNNSIVTFYHTDDFIEKKHMETKINYEESGLSKDMLESFMQSTVEQMKGIKGVEYKLDFKKEDLLITQEMNYKILDFDKYDGVETPFQMDREKETSLKENIKILEDTGYTKKK